MGSSDNSGVQLRATARDLFVTVVRANPGLTVLAIAGVIWQPLIDTVSAVLTGMLVGSVPGAVSHGYSSPEGRRMMTLLVIVATLFIVRSALMAIAGVPTTMLSRWVDGHIRDRVLAAVFRPVGISHLEDPRYLDELSMAQGLGGGLMTPGGAVVALAQKWVLRLQSVVAAALVAYYLNVLVAVGLLAAGQIGRWVVLNKYMLAPRQTIAVRDT